MSFAVERIRFRNQIQKWKSEFREWIISTIKLRKRKRERWHLFIHSSKQTSQHRRDKHRVLNWIEEVRRNFKRKTFKRKLSKWSRRVDADDASRKNCWNVWKEKLVWEFVAKIAQQNWKIAIVRHRVRQTSCIHKKKQEIQELNVRFEQYSTILTCDICIQRNEFKNRNFKTLSRWFFNETLWNRENRRFHSTKVLLNVHAKKYQKVHQEMRHLSENEDSLSSSLRWIFEIVRFD